MKAVILARVSSKEQEEGHSLDAQSSRLTEYAIKKQLDIIQIFSLTESSTRGGRKKFHEMIKFIKSQKEKIALICDKVDRLQRGFNEQPLLNTLLQQDKIEIHFMTEGQVITKDSNSATKLMWNMSIVMAQSYTDCISDNVKRSINHKIKNGEWIGKAPIGYLNERTTDNKSNIYPDPERAKIIQQLFKSYGQGGMSFKELKILADNMGLKSNTSTPRLLAVSKIYDIICNPFYYGEMKIKGILYKHKYQPIISRELWKRCEAIRNGYNKTHTAYSEKPFLYRGLIRCAYTGKICTSEIKKEKYTYITAYNKNGNRIYIPEDDITEQIAYILSKIQIPDEILEEITSYLKKSKQVEVNYHKSEIKRLRQRLDLNQVRTQKLIDLYIDKQISQDAYNLKFEDLKSEKLEIENTITMHSVSDSKFNDTLISIFEASAKAHEIFVKSSDLHQKRKLLKSVFRTLEIKDFRTLEIKDGSIGFSLHFPFNELAKIGIYPEWRP